MARRIRGFAAALAAVALLVGAAVPAHATTNLDDIDRNSVNPIFDLVVMRPIGLAATGSPAIAIVTGVLTATFGGVLRDVLYGDPTVLMRREIYITAALLGASVFVAAFAFGMPSGFASLLAFAAAFGLRGGALHFGWALPSYGHAPGRSPDEALNKEDR